MSRRAKLEIAEVNAVTSLIPTWVKDLTDSSVGDAFAQQLITELQGDKEARPPFSLTDGVLSKIDCI